ncbi:DNRLRE domain-containing protein [Marinigracilibium pacificum]|uniref:DNRLRE domain-containing protein n=1 Tax=Marinigracilibium pacificum TaxID=2729599 RepID=A0A848J751_9BACT|nr:DNRLRE domain-containing protein [Marinigracilibium pacificum]NMM50330.1 DNRLRE domain-containing protein [Marinigracilibium pacificum]
MNKILYLGLIYLIFFNVYGQQDTLILSSGSGVIDVSILQDQRSGYEYRANTTYGSHQRIEATAWTVSGQKYFYRTLLKFDLSQIPSGSTILSAKLKLYSDPAVTSSSAYNGNSQLSGSNAVNLEKITESWNETTVTWNNQPNSDILESVWVQPSSTTTENIEINILEFVNEWLSDPSSNFGLKFKLDNEVYYRARNYASTNHPNSSIHPKLEIIYSTDGIEYSDLFQNNIDHTFEFVDRSETQTGLLKEYGLDHINLETFNGQESDSNVVSMDQGLRIYSSLYSMQFYNDIGMLTPDEFQQKIKTKALENTDVTNIVSIYYEYDIIKNDAFLNSLFEVQNDQIYDVDGRPTRPYELRETFAVFPTRHYFEGKQQIFRFSSELYETNTTKTLTKISAYFNDGNGFSDYQMDQDIVINYPTDGQKTLIFSFHYDDGTVKTVSSKIVINKASPTNYRGYTIYSQYPPEMEIVGTRPYNGEVKKGLVTLLFSPDGIFDKPFIVVEGFDIWKIKDETNPYLNNNYESMFWRSKDGGLSVQLPSGKNFIQELSDQGYDLVFVDYDDGTADIRQNAYMFEEVLNWVNQTKVGTQENVVIGYSMGGLVAKVALREMEMRGDDHQVSHYISYDTPHLGANVPIGGQAAIKHLTGIGVKLGLPPLLLVKTPWKISDFVPELKELNVGLAYADLPAAKQMIINRVVGGGDNLEIDNGIHDSFVNYLNNTLGMPQNARNLAISNGSECGGDIGFTAGESFADGKGLVYNPSYWQGLAFAGLAFTNYYKASGGIFLNVFSTDTDVNFRTDIRSAKTSGERVYLGELEIYREILWGLGHDTDVVFSKDYRPEGIKIQPYDNASGGLFDLSTLEIADTLPGNIPVDIKKFSFVPVISALNIGQGNLTVDESDLFKSYSQIRELDLSEYTDFDNYFITAGNTPHTKMTKESADWILKEITTNNSFYSCYSTCGDPNIFQIAGSSSICGEETYFIEGVSPNAQLNYSWSYSNTLDYISGQNTNSLTVVPNGTTGPTYVKVVISDNCGSMPEIVKEITLGSPDVSQTGVYGNQNIYLGTISSVTVQNLPEYTSFDWVIPQGCSTDNSGRLRCWNEISNSSPNGLTYTAGTLGYHNITLQLSNECGTKSVSLPVIVSDNTQPFSMSTSISPNPSDDGNFNVTVSDSSEPETYGSRLSSSETQNTSINSSNIKTSQTSRINNTIFDVEVIDYNGVLMYKNTFSESNFTMNLQNLPDGNYWVIITIDGQRLSEQQIILDRQ